MPSPPEERDSDVDAPLGRLGSDEAKDDDTKAQPLEGASRPEAAQQSYAPVGNPNEKPATSPPDYKAVARISTQAVLQSIDLASLHAELEDGVAVPGGWAASANRSEEASANFDREGLTLVVQCAFEATWSPEPLSGVGPEASAAAPLQLRARFRLEYGITGLGGILDGDEEHFARTNGMLHAWPYWRETAQSMTVRLGLTPLVVGTFKIPWSGDPGREKKATVASRSDAEPASDSTADAAIDTPQTSESVGEKHTPQGKD